jgi:hypothetical protein
VISRIARSPEDVTCLARIRPDLLVTRPASMSDVGMVINRRNGATMKNLRTLSAAVALAAILPLATPAASLAAERDPGACTPPAGDAVGTAGPAMNAGQLMAGVGQCQRIGRWYPDYRASVYGVGAAPSDPYEGY